MQFVRTPHDVFLLTYILLAGLITVRCWRLIRRRQLTWLRGFLVGLLLFLSFLLFGLSKLGGSLLIPAALCLVTACVFAAIPDL